MKHLEDKALGDLLKKKLTQVNADVPTPAWQEIEGLLPPTSSVFSMKILSAFLIMCLLMLFPVHQYSKMPVYDNLSGSSGEAAIGRPSGRPSQISSLKNSFSPHQNKHTTLPASPVQEDARTTVQTIELDSPVQSFQWVVHSTASHEAIPPFYVRKSGLLPTYSDPYAEDLRWPVAHSREIRRPVRKSWIPGSVTAFSQMAFHTLTPFKGDESRVAASGERVAFGERLGFRLQANYPILSGKIRGQVGPLFNYYQTRMNYTVINSDGERQFLTNERLDAGLHLALILEPEQFLIPGYAFGGLSTQWRLLGSGDPSKAYKNGLVHYELGYGYEVIPGQRIEFMYRSFLNDQAYENLGQLRPHFYHIGYKWSF